MADKEVNVSFGARTGEFDAAMAEMAKAVNAAAAKIRGDLSEMASSTKTAESKIEASTSSIGVAFNRMRSTLGGAISGVSSVLGGLYRSVFSVHTAIVALVGGGLVASVKAALSTAAAIKDTANAAAVSTQYLQEMSYAAAQNGASAEVLGDALIKLNKRIGDLRNGGGPAAGALKQLGLDTQILSGQLGNNEQAMDAVLRKLREVPSDADRASLASDLFGRSAGPKLAEFLKMGEAAIAATREEARRLGVVLTDDMIQKADEADDKMNALFQTLQMQGVAAIASNAEAIGALATAFNNEVPTILEWLRRLFESLGLIDRTPQRLAEVQIRQLERLREVLIANSGSAAGTFAAGFASWLGGGPATLAQVEAKLAELKGKYFRSDYDSGYKMPATTDGLLGSLQPKAGRGNDPAVSGPGGSGEDPAVALARSSAQQQIQIERDKELSKLGIWQQSIQQRQQLGTLSDQNYLIQAAVILASETAIKRRAIEQQLELENLKPQQRLALQGQLEQLEIEHQQRLAEIKLEAERMAEEARQREIAAEREKNQQIAKDREQMANDIEGFTNRLLNGQLTAQSILMQVAQEAQNFIVKLIADRVAAAIAGEQAETQAVGFGANIRKLIKGDEGKSILGAQIMKALKTIATAAAETFASVYAFFAPTMGPFAAIPAGIAAAAVGASKLLIPSAAGGTEVQADGLHYLHKDEVVLPTHWTRRMANLADALEFKPGRPNYGMPGGAAASGSGPGSGGSSGASIGTVVIQAWDATGISDLVRRNASEFGSAMHRLASDGYIKPA